MNEAIAVMLKNYGPIRNVQDEENALKEIIQQITLLGLHRGGFFENASFYGGTALRMLYGLDRFSEDLDFCLLKPDREFSFRPYLQSIIDELARFGFLSKVEEKRCGPDAAIGSAFIKQNTHQALLKIDRRGRRLPKDQILKVKLEVDKDNPTGAKRALKLVKLPVPFMVGTLSESSLFAGKLHALVARSYLNRVKGRDYYDFLFYMARRTPVNMGYLEAKLRDSGHFTAPDPLGKEVFVKILKRKFNTVDFEKAKSDVKPFIKMSQLASLADWSRELFCAMADGLEPETD